VSKRQLTAGQWRVVSYLYHPDLLNRRLSPTLAQVIDKQDVDRDDVIEVVERGYVQPRVGGEECGRNPLKQLPAKAVRLRLTRSGLYHAGQDPQHAVMCALRTGQRFTLWDLMYRLDVKQPQGSLSLAPRITFDELFDMADRFLFDAFLADDDTKVYDIRKVSTIPGLVYAKQTKLGASYAAYL